MEGLSDSTGQMLVEIVTMLRETPSLRTHYHVQASRVRVELDQSRIMEDANRLPARVWAIDSMQRYATYDAERGGIPDLASWCESQWQRVLQDDPENFAALTGNAICSLDIPL